MYTRGRASEAEESTKNIYVYAFEKRQMNSTMLSFEIFVKVSFMISLFGHACSNVYKSFLIFFSSKENEKALKRAEVNFIKYIIKQ